MINTSETLPISKIDEDIHCLQNNFDGKGNKIYDPIHCL